MSAFAVSEPEFRNRTVTVDGVAYRYVVSVPVDWNAQQKWPVILFLHGAGERGDDGLKQTTVGLPLALKKFPERYPAIVVMPQCREEVAWGEPAMEAQALAALDAAIKEFNGDPQRVYLTGLSLGGYGTFNLAARHPGRFAAYAPVCGGVRASVRAMRLVDAAADPAVSDPLAYVARRIGKTPIWIFHGTDDPVVPVHGSRDIAATLRALGGNVRYTEYPLVGHNSWDRAYGTPEFAQWLLAQKLAK